MEAFEKYIEDKYDIRIQSDVRRMEGARWAAEAIKSNPHLIWPEGEKWMSDEEVYELYRKEMLNVEYTLIVRDKAQGVIDALRWHNKIYRDPIEQKDKETATLRQQLEEARKENEQYKEYVHETLYAHYKKNGGFTRTATDFIRKLTNSQWDRDKEIDEVRAENAALKKEVEWYKTREYAGFKYIKNITNRFRARSKQVKELESSRDEFAIKFAEWVVNSHWEDLDNYKDDWGNYLQEYKSKINETPGTTDPF